MSDQPYVPAPSEVLDPSMLDQALLVVVVHPDSTAFTSVRSGVDRAGLSAWLHELADVVAVNECESCAAGIAHEHPPEG